MPDLSTLRLCSLLASGAFTLVFLAFAVGARREPHWWHWAASSLLYAAALVGFDMGPGLLGCAALYGVLALTNVLVLSGVRSFDGLAPFAPWMLVPLSAGALGYLLPGLLVPGEAALWASRVGGTAGLMLSMGLTGALLAFGRRDEPDRGRRIAGAAMLAYLPGYAFAIVAEAGAATMPELTALVPMLSDQLLLSLLNLGLLAMQGERAQAALRALALHDPLTGALNRAGLAALRPEPGTAVVLVDVDHFKAINDRHGHAAGDAVLVALAATARARLPGPRDRIARLGGDEFAVVLHGADAGAARSFAEGMRAALHAAAGVPPFTASLGLAAVAQGEADLAPALARADAALYAAKAAGRDRAA